MNTASIFPVLQQADAFCLAIRGCPKMISCWPESVMKSPMFSFQPPTRRLLGFVISLTGMSSVLATMTEKGSAQSCLKIPNMVVVAELMKFFPEPRSTKRVTVTLERVSV